MPHWCPVNNVSPQKLRQKHTTWIRNCKCFICISTQDNKKQCYQQQFMDKNAEVLLEFHVLTIKKQVKFCYWCEGKKEKNSRISRLKITAVQLCPLCRTSGANVTDGRRRQIIPCSALLFSAQLCRHPQLSWRAIWPIRGEGDTHTQTHRDWSVFPP